MKSYTHSLSESSPQGLLLRIGIFFSSTPTQKCIFLKNNFVFHLYNEIIYSSSIHHGGPLRQNSLSKTRQFLILSNMHPNGYLSNFSKINKFNYVEINFKLSYNLKTDSPFIFYYARLAKPQFYTLQLFFILDAHYTSVQSCRMSQFETNDLIILKGIPAHS